MRSDVIDALMPTMSHDIETQIDIDAAPEQVWKVLTDFSAYASWNPFVTKIEGAPAPASRLRIRVEPPGGAAMTFRPRVTHVEPNRSLAWLGRLGIPGLFDGAHRFELVTLPGGRTRLIHAEHFTGMLVPLFRKSLDDKTRKGFEAMNAALKVRVEEAAGST
jgi:hypothetical protein